MGRSRCYCHWGWRGSCKCSSQEKKPKLSEHHIAGSHIACCSQTDPSCFAVCHLMLGTEIFSPFSLHFTFQKETPFGKEWSNQDSNSFKGVWRLLDSPSCWSRIRRLSYLPAQDSSTPLESLVVQKGFGQPSVEWGGLSKYSQYETQLCFISFF